MPWVELTPEQLAKPPYDPRRRKGKPRYVAAPDPAAEWAELQRHLAGGGRSAREVDRLARFGAYSDDFEFHTGEER